MDDVSRLSFSSCSSGRAQLSSPPPSAFLFNLVAHVLLLFLLLVLTASGVPVVSAQQETRQQFVAAASSSYAADVIRPPPPPPLSPPAAAPPPPPPPPLPPPRNILVRNALHPAAVDVTATTTYAYPTSDSNIDDEDDDTDGGASSRGSGRRSGGGVTVSAFGTNTVPGQIHFVSYCERTHNAFHEGHVTLPAGVGAVRSAASVGQYAAWGTDQSPGVVVPGGALRGPEYIVLQPGEDTLAAATAGAGGVFLFATWTAPTRVIKFQASLHRRQSTHVYTYILLKI